MQAPVKQTKLATRQQQQRVATRLQAPSSLLSSLPASHHFRLVLLRAVPALKKADLTNLIGSMMEHQQVLHEHLRT